MTKSQRGRPQRHHDWNHQREESTRLASRWNPNPILSQRQDLSRGSMAVICHLIFDTGQQTRSLIGDHCADLDP